MNKLCKTCKKSTAGDHGHCPKCYKNLSPEAKRNIEEKCLTSRGHTLEKTLDKW